MCVRFLGEFSLGDKEHVFCFLGDFGFRKHSFNPQLVFFDDLGDRDEHWGPSMHKGFFDFFGDFGLGDNDLVLHFTTVRAVLSYFK